jgi:rsbT co-antagonist protein RsbR
VSKDTSAALLEGFFSCCPEMFFIAAVDGAMLTWSDTLGRALGPALDQGKSLTALAHPDDQTAVNAAWSRLRQSTEPVLFRGRFADASGAHKAFSCHARRAPGGDTIHGWLSVDSAGADQPDAAGPASLKAKERLLHGMIDNLPVSVWALDATGTFTFHDGKGLERAGLERGQFLGMNITGIYAGGAPDNENVTGVQRALAGEASHYSSDTQDTTWENWIVPVRSAAGEVESVLGFSLDITDAKRAERELRTRLELIEKQQEVIRNLSTPIIEVWDGVLTLPMVGIVDSIRTADVMDSLLRRIVDTQARFAILDLTGVEMVDTRVASHLIQLVSAIRLLGAEGIVAGIKPTVAQTMVALGLDLSQIVTQRNLRAGLSYCLKRMSAPRSPSSGSPAGKT